MLRFGVVTSQRLSARAAMHDLDYVLELADSYNCALITRDELQDEIHSCSIETIMYAVNALDVYHGHDAATFIVVADLPLYWEAVGIDQSNSKHRGNSIPLENRWQRHWNNSFAAGRRLLISFSPRLSISGKFRLRLGRLACSMDTSVCFSWPRTLPDILSRSSKPNRIRISPRVRH